MQLLIYTYDADALPSLLEETADAEEAVATCRALVEEDGYPRAEVWDGAGDRLYAVIRAGAAVLTLGSASEVVERAPRTPRDERRREPVVERVVSVEPDVDGADGADGADEREAEVVEAADMADVPEAAGGAAAAGNGASHGPEEAGPAGVPPGVVPSDLLGQRTGRNELWFGL